MPTLRGSNAGNNALTIAASPTSTITVGGGKLLVIVVAADNTAQATVTVADNSGQAGSANVYTQRLAAVPIGGNNASAWIFECAVTRPILATDVVTVTFAAAEFNMAVFLVTDSTLVAGDSMDTSAGIGRTNTSTWGGASAMPSTPNSLALALVADHASNSTGSSAPAGYTQLGLRLPNGQFCAVFYRVVAGTGAQTPSGVLTGGAYGGNDNGAQTVILKATKPAGRARFAGGIGRMILERKPRHRKRSSVS